MRQQAWGWLSAKLLTTTGYSCSFRRADFIAGSRVGHKVLSLKKHLSQDRTPGNCAKFAKLLPVRRLTEIRRFLPSFLLGTPENVLAVQTLVVSLMDSPVNS